MLIRRAAKKRTRMAWVGVLSVVALLLSMQPVGAAPPVRQYSLSLSTNPTDVKAAHVATYTVTLTNSASSTATIGAADLTVNANFTAVSNLSVSSVAGTWTGNLAGAVIQARAATGSDRLDAGESVTISFDATAPCAAGSYPIFTTTNVGTLAGTWNFSLVGGVPQVAVSLTPTSLLIGSITDADGDLGLAANEPFNVVVNADANVDCDTLVTLSETGPGSFTSTPTGTIPAGESQVTISATYGTSDSGFNVCATATGLTQGCQVVNVAIDHQTGSAPEGTGLTLQAGGVASSSSASATGSLSPTDPTPGPCETDPGHPICVFITLPDGTDNTSATVATFECAGFGDLTASDCPGGQLILFLGDEATIERIYTIDNFYLMTVECDRTVCGRGGVSSYVSFIDPTNTGLEANFIQSPACTPSVNDAIDPPTYGFCTDYNASHYDNAQDLFLVHRMAIDYGRR